MKRLARVKEMAKLLPVNMGHRTGRQIYAFGLSDGRTKIGSTKLPRGRFRTHMHAHGERLAWFHLFGAGYGSCWTEGEILRQVAAAGFSRVDATKEWFHDLSRQAVLTIARPVIAEHCADRLVNEQMAREKAAMKAAKALLAAQRRAKKQEKP